MGLSVFDPQIQNPNYPSLETAAPDTVERYLFSRNFLAPGEQVSRVEPIGAGTRNTILRVTTESRSFVMKQFRAWPAGTRPAPGPEARFRAETGFYRAARIADCARAALPELLHQDAKAACLILEDAGTALPLAGRAIAPEVAAQLGWFLVALHHHSRSVPVCAHYRNEPVVGWQMARLFCGRTAPARGGRGTWLGRWCAGGEAVRYALEDALSALERGGASLVHGDYTPANWVQNGHGPRVVDGEFSFFGPPEYDAGAYLAGLLAGRQSVDTVRAAVDVITRGCFRYDARLVATYAGVHLCDALDLAAASGSEGRLQGRAAAAVLRRLHGAVEQRSLAPLVRA